MRFFFVAAEGKGRVDITTQPKPKAKTMEKVAERRGLLEAAHTAHTTHA